MKILICYSVLISIFLTWPVAVRSATYYVSPSGSDTAAGTLVSPWKTIGKASDSVSAGDTVFIRGGVYQQSIYISRSGTADSLIRFVAYNNETPVIDGNNYSLAQNWGALLNLAGDYIQVSGLEVRYSGGMGVILTGHHNTADRINSHHNKENGILITGNFGIVENSEVWSNCMSNYAGNSSGGWASGLSAARHPDGAIIRSNITHGNWGEGLSTYESTNTTIEDNISYDNWSVNIYISDTTGTLIQRNFVYRTGSLGSTGAQRGISFGDEVCNPESSDNKVINNIVWGTNSGIEYWGTANCSTHGLRNVVIANNTIVDTESSHSGIYISSAGGNSNTRIQNNLVVQTNNSSVCTIESTSGLTLGYNLWSKQCSKAITTDITGDPLLLKTGTMTDPSWFKLSSGSSAVNKGTMIALLTSDYFKTARPQGSAYDIGAHEFTSSTPSPTQMPPSPTGPAVKAGDANGDGAVNVLDFSILSSHFGKGTAFGYPDGDFNGDGTVNILDFSILSANFGR